VSAIAAISVAALPICMAVLAAQVCETRPTILMGQSLPPLQP